MINKLLFFFVVSVVLLVFDSTALAVTGNGEITVTRTGKPLPGTTVSLLSKESGNTVTSTTTDSSGIAKVSAEEGTYLLQVGEGEERSETSISITGGQTTSVTIDLPAIGSPPFTAPPMVTGTYTDEQVDDFPLVESVDRISDTINGQQVPTQTKQNDAGDLNNRFDFALDWNQVSGTFAVGIAHTEHFFPSVNVTVGRVDVSFKNQNLTNPANTNLFEGDGLVLGAGIDIIFAQQDHLFGGAGYTFTGYYNVDVTRQRPLIAPGGTVTLDEVEISYYAHQIRSFVGYGVGIVYPYAGVAIWFREMSIEGTQEADFTQSAGFPVIRRSEFTNEFEDNTAAALVGAMIRAGHFVAGIEGTFGGDFTTVRVNAGVGF